MDHLPDIGNLEAHVLNLRLGKFINAKVFLHGRQVLLIRRKDERIVHMVAGAEGQAKHLVPALLTEWLPGLKLRRQFRFPDHIAVQRICPAMVTVKLRTDANIVQIRLDVFGAVDHAVRNEVIPQGAVRGHLLQQNIFLHHARRVQDIVHAVDGVAVQHTLHLHLILPAHALKQFCQLVELPQGLAVLHVDLANIPAQISDFTVHLIDLRSGRGRADGVQLREGVSDISRRCRK